MFPEVQVQISLESTVFLLTFAVLENHEIFFSCFSEDDSEIESMKIPTKLGTHNRNTWRSLPVRIYTSSDI